MTALHGVALSATAAHWLATTTTARVLNVFDRACNLMNQNGDVLALVTSARGLTPFALVVQAETDAPFRGLPADSPVRTAPGAKRLWLGPLQVDYAAAQLWEACPDWPAIRALYGAGSLAQLAGLVGEVELPDDSLLDLFRPASSGNSHAAALMVRARPAAEQLVAGLSRRDDRLAVAGAQSLAGLGGGLTPAGDDFIVGVLLAAWAGLYGPGAEYLSPALVAAAAPRTTTLSGAYLRAAAVGECTAHWHTLFAAQQHGDHRAAREAVQALVSIGHTSGADALAGFSAVHFMQPLSGSNALQPSSLFLT